MYATMFRVLVLAIAFQGVVNLPSLAQDRPAPHQPPPHAGQATFGAWTLQSYQDNNGFWTCLLGVKIAPNTFLEWRAQQMTAMDLLVTDTDWHLEPGTLGPLRLIAPHHQWQWPAVVLGSQALHANLSDDPKTSEAMVDLLLHGPEALALALPASVQIGPPIPIPVTGFAAALAAMGACTDALPKPLAPS